MEETRESLFESLRGTAADRAWEQFYERYWEPIVRYAQKLGLSEADAHDVLQETMVALMRLLPTFRYDPAKGKFRNFLLTIVHRRALSGMRRAAKYPHHSLDAEEEKDGGRRVDRLVAEDSPDLQALDELRWKQCLFEKALRVIQDDSRVDAKTFGVFRAYAIEGRPCAEVALEFGEKQNNVYQIRNRLLRRLQDEVTSLTQGQVAS